jgi:hypothetical protein
MYVLARSISSGILFLLIAALPLGAQGHAVSVGYGGGGIWFGSFNEGAGSELALDPGWLATAQVDWWPGSRRIGGRATSSFTQRPLSTSGDVRSINTWLFSGDLLLRLLPATEGRTVNSFLSLGAGVVSYGLGDGDPLHLPAEHAVYPGNTDRQFAAVGGLGFDVMPRGASWFGTPIGFRLEAADHIVLKSPFEEPEGDRYGPVHNIRVNLSLLGLVELLR